MKTTKVKRDIYQEVTDRVIEQMETSSTKWINPMIKSGGVPMNPTTGNNSTASTACC